MKKIIKRTCTHCGRTGRDRGNWNADMRQGRVVGVRCPACQSPEQNAEAEINLATTEYLGADSFGRIRGRSKVS